MKIFKVNFILLFFVFSISNIVAQKNKTKIDGVAGVVGDYIILDSDIDKSYIELKAQGISTKEIDRCQMLGKLLEDKLYAHQAVQDSIVVTDTEVNQRLDEQMSYIVEQLGSMDKALEYFKKNDESELRESFFDVIKEGKLATSMQKKIVDDVTITPEEVRDFFKKIPKEDLPVFGVEMEVAQIVIKPVITKEAEQQAINQLIEIKKEIKDGSSSFFSKAVLYSEDTGSRSTGGYYKINRKTPFVKEFKDVAFSLQEGEISDPFKTEFGYHIIFVEKIKGQDLEIRHILIKPKVTTEEMKKAKEKIESIRNKILNKEISFTDAAKQFSDEKETKSKGGTLVNPRTQDTRFELTKMDPSLYGLVANLKDGEISLPTVEEDKSTNSFYKILTVTNRYDEHTADYAKDYGRLKELALKEKQLKAIAKWSTEKIKETYIKINGEYRDCNFTNNWLKK